MILIERWVVAALLGLGLASVVGATGQSPAGKTQDKQQAKPSPELPPWDSAQPPPPIRPPSPEDSKPDPDDDPMPPEDATPDASQPATPANSAQQPEAAPAPPPTPPPAPPQEAAKPAPPADLAPPDEGPKLPPATDPAQRKMEKDTADLLRLVRELKAEVNKAGSNTLSIVAVQKTEEIQKLVKSLKEQMRERGFIVANKQ